MDLPHDLGYYVLGLWRLIVRESNLGKCQQASDLLGLCRGDISTLLLLGPCSHTLLAWYLVCLPHEATRGVFR